MKKYLFLFITLGFIVCCKTPTNKPLSNNEINKKVSDTIRIANEELEYEIIIIDAGFSSWLASYARPRNFYSQQYLEARNRIWVIEWNSRAMQPSRFNSGIFEMQIDYQSNINYGYEVNYMLFNYLNYVQIRNNIKLGGFVARY